VTKPQEKKQEEPKKTAAKDDSFDDIPVVVTRPPPLVIGNSKLGDLSDSDDILNQKTKSTAANTKIPPLATNLGDLSDEEDIPKPTKTDTKKTNTPQNVNNIFGVTDETAIYNNTTKTDNTPVDLGTTGDDDDDLFGDL